MHENEYSDDETKFRLIGAIATLANKYLNETTLKKVWEVFQMGAVFEKFQKEENKKMLKLGAKVMKMIVSGKTVEEISQETGLTEEEVSEIIDGFEK